MIADATAYNAKRDSLSYPPIPAEATEFQNKYGWEVPQSVLGWDWSATFGRWSAFVEFSDGKRVWTYPKTW